MKSKTLIFSLYLLMLTVYPCMDENTCADEQRTGMELKVNTTDHDHSESETDLCTPFCHCACCATNVRLTVSQVVLPTYTHNTIHTIPYTNLPLLSNSQAIWQPPRIS